MNKPLRDSFLVTHYSRQFPERALWIPLPFVSRQPGDTEHYYFGFDRTRAYSHEDIQARVATGSLCPLDRPHSIDTTQRLWLATNEDVWLASATDPFHDASRLLVDPGQIRRVREARSLTLAHQPSPVVDDIYAKDELVSLAGDYLNSKVMAGKPYKPLWQQHLVDLVSRRVADRLGTPVAQVARVPREHRYGHIAALIRSHDVALCLELILRDEDRAATNIDIVPLGNVTHYAIVFHRNGPIQGRLSAAMEDGEAWHREKQWFKYLVDSGAICCGHRDTAADHALEHLVARGELHADYKDGVDGIVDLRDWLLAHPADGVVACDIGVVRQLGALDVESAFAHLLVPYPRAIPFGLPYDARDPVWGAILHDAMSQVLQSQDHAIQVSLRETADRFADVGARWLMPLEPLAVGSTDALAGAAPMGH